MLYNCATFQDIQSTLCVHLMVAKSQKRFFCMAQKPTKTGIAKKLPVPTAILFLSLMQLLILYTCAKFHENLRTFCVYLCLKNEG